MNGVRLRHERAGRGTELRAENPLGVQIVDGTVTREDFFAPIDAHVPRNQNFAGGDIELGVVAIEHGVPDTDHHVTLSNGQITFASLKKSLDLKRRPRPLPALRIKRSGQGGGEGQKHEKGAAKHGADAGKVGDPPETFQLQSNRRSRFS